MGYNMVDLQGGKASDMAESLRIIAAAHAADVDLTDEKAIQRIVRINEAKNFFSIGDQLVPVWNDGNSHDYDLNMDVVAFHDAQNAQDETVPGLWLQSHWGLPGVQFDASEAIMVCAEALPAGTYHFTIGTNWGTHCIKDKVYEFTTTVEIPAGGQIVIGSNTSFWNWGAPDVAPANWRVYTFKGPKYVTALETLTLEEGEDGEDLGNLNSATKYSTTGVGLNNLQRAAYGYNRWSQSGIRQWMNSDAAKATVGADGLLSGGWWEPQNPYDRPPQQITTMDGFMRGLPDEFLAAVQPIKVTTALNTVSDGGIGTSEVTLDKFFLASLEQEYIVPQIAGVEGAYWPYWKERLGLNSPQAQGSGGTNAKHIRYAIENHASAQSVRLRSAHRGTAFSAWIVYASGTVSTYYATSAYRPAPACVIC